MLATRWDAKMKDFMIEFMFIPGFSIGFEWYGIGEVCDTEGYFNIDLGIIRFLLTYNND